MIKVFVGYDHAEAVSFNVLSHSIQNNSSVPVAIIPVRLSQLEGVFNRDRNALQSTEFSFSRFLVPYLCDYEGWAIFMDCDMLVKADIKELWDQRDERYAVQVVKHNHQPEETVKFLGAVQTKYEKKNWSSVMMFNCKKCKALTPEYVNTASGLELHQFKWLESDDQIGDITNDWNHLVGYDKYREDAKLIHYTVGGPYFEEYQDCDYAEDWFAYRDDMLHCSQRGDVQKKVG
ncbi:hypothetical protein [Litoribrevibacter albus]|uniref:Glycosyltransferase n=1 Tax=Litoribrevibacter albus TaxID=1473156 RepID=A0AA37SAK8_9GAMM|nr:hypothetical protein [Litoribrevibacter albus]GLQ32220.1 hypothetical protein GCM10007876_26990 [Litoribrevibacter albus]